MQTLVLKGGCLSVSYFDKCEITTKQESPPPPPPPPIDAQAIVEHHHQQQQQSHKRHPSNACFVCWDCTAQINLCLFPVQQHWRLKKHYCNCGLFFCRAERLELLWQLGNISLKFPLLIVNRHSPRHLLPVQNVQTAKPVKPLNSYLTVVLTANTNS